MKIIRTVILPDAHYPETDKDSFAAVLDFVRKTKPQRIVMLGDNLDCQPVSRHSKGKPGLREVGGLRKDIDGFMRDIMGPLEKASPSAKRIMFEGNHEAWVQQLLDEQPELQGCLDLPRLLELNKRGWEWVPQGKTRFVGKVLLMHGDSVGSSMYVSKKLVESYCCTAIMGHVHTAQMFTKTSAARKNDKWIGVTLPGLCDLAPRYAKSRPNSWLHGFGVIEEWGNFFTLYLVVITAGGFVYGGRKYGK